MYPSFSVNIDVVLVRAVADRLAVSFVLVCLGETHWVKEKHTLDLH